MLINNLFVFLSIRDFQFNENVNEIQPVNSAFQSTEDFKWLAVNGSLPTDSPLTAGKKELKKAVWGTAEASHDTSWATPWHELVELENAQTSYTENRVKSTAAI